MDTQLKPLYIHHHLGLGDHFVCNGLVRHLLEDEKREVILAVKRHNYETVKALYSDARLTLDPVKGDKGAASHGADNNYLRIGFKHKKFPHWEKSFYDQLGIPYKYRFSKWHLPRNKSAEQELYNEVAPTSPYAFCNIACSAGNADVSIDTDLPTVFLYKKTKRLFDWLQVIENAQEIHTIDSSVFQLIKNLTPPQPKFFYTATPKQRSTPSQFDGQKWIIKKRGAGKRITK